ncbi:hypothetical protein AQ490_25860 [Wenjunlia vitaminophila]|uniref:Uncharacterized protein n=1 Tax=Wenjunlia vitaminophila TaxID=76728 RepID=A0A0T6LQG8_WENVI|nr:hypothetical protein [Wenjunlia vitaminophila]KRV48228.1 hypothetical protein AQ490_25860 [Wenjunlia vitaminophila]
MVLSISAVLFLLILAAIFLHSGRLRWSHALVCVLLGFYLAHSSMAEGIESGLSATADVVSDIHP